MTKQPEALRLAITPGAIVPVDVETTSALCAELRRLHEENRILHSHFNKEEDKFLARIAALEKALGMAVEALETEASAGWEHRPKKTVEAIAALRERLADTTHSCSYHCERPECVRAQRDELRERLAREERETRKPCVRCGQGLLSDMADTCYSCAQNPARQEQEPVACSHGWIRTGAMAPGEMRCIHCGEWRGIAAPQREWVGLTEEDLEPIADEYRILFGGWVHDFARAIEAKLKEKNA